MCRSRRCGFVADVTKHNVTVLCDGKLTGELFRHASFVLVRRMVVDQRLHTVFVPPSSALGSSDGEASDEADDDVDDVDYAHHDGETVDLAPSLREFIILAVPITVHCKEDCRGLCPLRRWTRIRASALPACRQASPFSALRDVKL